MRIAYDTSASPGHRPMYCANCISKIKILLKSIVRYVHKWHNMVASNPVTPTISSVHKGVHL